MKKLFFWPPKAADREYQLASKVASPRSSTALSAATGAFKAARQTKMAVVKTAARQIIVLRVIIQLWEGSEVKSQWVKPLLNLPHPRKVVLICLSVG